jgi:4-carboxymuconolactone decarboxylase
VSRLSPFTEDQLDDAARAVWDDVTSGRRGPKASLVNPEGALVGPFNALVHARAIGGRSAKLGEAIRFDASFDRRLVELAMITVGSHWQAEFEWYVHGKAARELGIPDEVMTALHDGRPPFADDDQSPEAVVHRFAKQLVSTGRVSDDRYAAAKQLLGEQAVVELVLLVGYYSLVSFTLNAFEVPLPEGVSPAWPDADAR